MSQKEVIQARKELRERSKRAYIGGMIQERREHTRDYLAILPRIHRKSMNEFVYDMIGQILSASQELKAINQVKQ